MDGNTSFTGGETDTLCNITLSALTMLLINIKIYSYALLCIMDTLLCKCG